MYEIELRTVIPIPTEDRYAARSAEELLNNIHSNLSALGFKAQDKVLVNGYHVRLTEIQRAVTICKSFSAAEMVFCD